MIQKDMLKLLLTSPSEDVATVRCLKSHNEQKKKHYSWWVSAFPKWCWCWSSFYFTQSWWISLDLFQFPGTADSDSGTQPAWACRVRSTGAAAAVSRFSQQLNRVNKTRSCRPGFCYYIIIKKINHPAAFKLNLFWPEGSRRAIR